MDVNDAIKLMHQQLKHSVTCSLCGAEDPVEEVLKLEHNTEVRLHKDCPMGDILRVPIIKEILPIPFTVDQSLDACNSIISMDQHINDLDNLYADALKQIEALKAQLYPTP